VALEKRVLTRAQLLDAIPEPIVALLVNGMGAYHRINRYSAHMRRTLNEWRSLEGLEGAHYEAYQLDRLKHIARAASTTEYYGRLFRKCGFDPENIADLRDLERLPILEKDDLRQHWREMRVPRFRNSVVTRRSSGTTGEPVRFLQPRRMAYSQGFAMLYQFYAWFGFSPLERRATMAGRYLGRKHGGVVLRNVMEHQLLLGVHSLSETSARRYVAAIDRFRPAMLQAHPSALLRLKEICDELELPAPDVSLVSYTGETLTGLERASLGEWLRGAVIFGTYGSGENVVASSECPALTGFHVHPSVGICELIPEGGMHEVIGTSLLNDAMPLIRYRTGDIAERVSSEPCACGVKWPRLEGIWGRRDDVIVSADGTPIAPVVIRTGIAASGEMRAPYSLIQHPDAGSFTLQIYGDPEDGRAGNTDVVVRYLEATLGPGTTIRVEYVPRTHLLNGRGKHRTIIKEATT
jgi:phenylacetate-CoA ligase